MSDSLRIVVISASLEVDNPADANALNLAERSRSLRICLLENGYNLIAVLPVDVFLEQRLRQLQPIVMFTNDNNSSNARAAVAAGVSAYVVAGLSAERIRPILDVALARFEQEQQLRHELASTRNELHELSSELKDRKTIDRAKALLMKRQALSEDAAYAKLRKTAMDKNLKIVEVAQRILDVADLLS